MPPISDIRNIGIIAHIDAGKTTLSERMLFYSRKIHRMGEVHDGAATMDYMPEEQERGITITSACTSCQWREKMINLIDTPGHVDFTIEVERSLRVLDGAVGVFCAVGGVEPQSETVWRQSEHFAVPKIAFVNKMDRLGADFEAALEAIRRRLQTNAVAVTAPLGQGESFAGVLDLISGETLTFDPADQGRTVLRVPFSPREATLAAPWRETLLEKLAEADDKFLELWMEGSFSREDVRAALRRATLSRGLTPVLCGSALRNAGVQPVLDAVCDYLPSPLDVPAPVGRDAQGREEAVEPDPDAPPVALVFKVLMENGRKLSFLRLYAGQIREGDSLRNVTRKSDDRVGRIFRLHADRREQLESASAGEIAAVVGLRTAHTGETYAARARELVLESIEAYAPVLTLALEPRNADEGKTLDEALARYVEEDPTFQVSLDDDSGTRMISGMGELHLDVLLERMRREYGISPRAGQPQVVLRETVRREAEAEAVFDKELGKEHHQGAVALRVAPLPRHTGNQVTVGDFLPADPQEARKILPPALLQAALDGVRDGLQSGELTGWPLVDVAVTLTNVERREGLTTIPGCHMAAGQALREALSKAAPVALEPVMRVEINVPEDFLGPAISLFTAAGGKVEDLEDHAGRKLLRGTAPLRRLFGFSTSLRSATQGRAGLMLAFDRFDLP
ncbi:translation elongation factor G [Desulfovibrio sp. 6_1_46AFAA]|uniref:elongation factor G n=1 Tax=unclassified Desulfovibrio TaxID=2593640 RepID=UPI0001E12ED6|nr:MULTISPECIES: elongation factor G [unclassified Desulfovibrio]EFL85254.1 translation elongation factor G [Desulfovibrio sp. 3_1_syn3]EGW51814.1 translation elongation factor G [Desulfovibrio sp. 6_1_46AFAA]